MQSSPVIVLGRIRTVDRARLCKRPGTVGPATLRSVFTHNYDMVKFVLGCILAATTFPSPLIRRVTIGHVNIELEETTVAQAAKQLGNANIARTGDAGGSRAQACYATVGDRASRFYLESSEMGGGERITQVDVVSSGSATAAGEPIIATRCTQLARNAAAVQTDRGIALGLSREAVDRRLQGHGRDSVGVTLYEKSEDRGAGANAYSVVSWFRVRYVRGRVTAFSTGVVSSN